METINTGSTAHSHDKQGALGACCAESATYRGLLCLSPLNDLGRRDNIRPLSEQAIEKTGVQFRITVRASVPDNQNTVVLVHRLQCRREHNAAGDDPELWSHYCTLNEDGEVVDRGRFRTNPSGVNKRFRDLEPVSHTAR